MIQKDNSAMKLKSTNKIAICAIRTCSNRQDRNVTPSVSGAKDHPEGLMELTLDIRACKEIRRSRDVQRMSDENEKGEYERHPD